MASEKAAQPTATPGPKFKEPPATGDLAAADQLFRKGRLGLAVEAISRIIAEQPDRADAFALRARVKVELRQDADAQADFSTAIKLEPLENSYRIMRGRFLLGRGNTTAALRDFEAAIKLNPRDSQASSLCGSALLAKGDDEKAIAQLTKAIELDPKNIEAYNHRSFALLRRDRRKEAITDLDAAIKIDPESASSYNNRGLIRFQDNDQPGALADFSKAIALEPDALKYYIHRRRTLVKLDRFAEAQADAAKIDKLRKLRTINEQVFHQPKAVQPLLERGDFFLADGRTDLALANYDRVLELDKQNCKALLGRARVHAARKEYAHALTDAEAAIKIERTPEALALRGEAHHKLGHFAEAVADYDASQRFDTEVADAWEKHAGALRQAGHTAEAQAAQQRAAELNSLLAPAKK